MANTTHYDWSEYMGHQRLEDAAFALPKPQGFSRTLRNQPLTLTFDVEFPGERGAGLRAYSEQVTVTVDSGEPGGSPDEFTEEMLKFLSGWFDGAAVGLRPKNLRPNVYPTAHMGKIVYVTVPED